ncbi:MAG TPA: enoyl-CoA hydratase-related protein [Thermoplasmata archaeon]|nr:enoyl-CoA hydratase-related protein [Thermoplasmata archaeon]
MEPIRTERKGGVFAITIQRPEKLNALDVPSMLALRQALQSAATDRDARAVLLTGTGKAFCAGGDIAVMDEYRARGELPALFHALTGEMEGAIRELMGMSKPVVAALPGVAAGGGLSLALACDWRIASDDAVLVPAFPSLGAVPDGGLTYFLPHYLGIGLAQEVLFTEARIPAARGRDLGLLHEVVPAADLERRAWERATELAQGPTFAYGWTKRLLHAAYRESAESQMMIERRAAVEAARRGELPEGIRAFREKRKPKFPPS